MNIYRMTDQQVNNLLVFLDRVEYKGLKDVQAIQEILRVLGSPEKQEDEVN